MKKIVVLLVVVIFSCLSILASAEELKGIDNELSGKGTKLDPIRINNLEDLIYFRDSVNRGEGYAGMYFLQVNDIDMAEEENWLPIGIINSENYFWGVYNGNGKKLYNLNVEGNSEDACGLFGALGGKVYNLGIESGNVSGGYCGSIASHSVGNNAEIVNCYNKASITGNRAGGIADNFAGSISYCFNLGELNGKESSGEIVSYSADRISYCQFLGEETVPLSTFTGKLSDNKIYNNQNIMSNDLIDFNNHEIIKNALIEREDISLRKATSDHVILEDTFLTSMYKYFPIGFYWPSIILTLAFVAALLIIILKFLKKES